MANRATQPSQNYGAGRVYCEFKFTAPGAGTTLDLTTVNGADIVASGAHVAGTNVITLTLKDAYPAVISASADIRDDAGTGPYASVGNITNEGTSTPVTLKVAYFSAAGTALNNSVAVTSVVIAFKNTSGQGAK